ncbi:hypothetical protein MO973_18040 [Paenibacillus sp. TRM 82003]|uniref:hypothetical protein n=1 Tax=Kineococcus sp. TRM81007 TaxID=2925831 RepID=UPI001F5A5F02|nr:hypothetical protein [Kineococcus sp. TRM81007]MCI2238356.1 hypothetical protein [Kineococcus sp. TRM81007]MCI3922131.1 hypothetical protein [Paenibacillus sp. TRM 82003]
MYCHGFCTTPTWQHEGENRELFPSIAQQHPHLRDALRHLEGTAAIMESHFLDASPAEALDVARDVVAAGLVEHLHLFQVPIVLGRGARLRDGPGALEADDDTETVSTPRGVTPSRPRGRDGTRS